MSTTLPIQWPIIVIERLAKQLKSWRVSCRIIVQQKSDGSQWGAFKAITMANA